ncbi:hypothetical protein QAD02_018305 [Eretmocerus hayati]|uniref:Uncharacterized protein n=1 Tax=Eretmocerus hayati TaxID=131215 RepID=A0ACC2PHJ7_9HYME|nr:hypothetical protein QAD02_018305 [Eretmocerus hayati]
MLLTEEYYHTDMNLIEILCETLNCAMHIIDLKDTNSNIHLTHNSSYPPYGIFLPFDHNPYAPSTSQPEYENLYGQYLTQISIPVPDAFHFHLMRSKEYTREISTTAITAFSVLFFTAFIFSVWTRLLGFKERNWSFLNILTAQMGGSIEHRGKMKLSEMIFQMSIYIATFIVVTAGADYMMQIFISRGELNEIETIQNLADSDITLVMEEFDHMIMKHFFSDFINSDANLQKIYNRIEGRNLDPGKTTFCFKNNSPMIDESINLCFQRLKFERNILKSDDSLQIDKIKDAIIVSLPVIRLKGIPFFKIHLQALIYRFLQIGLIERLNLLRKRREMFYLNVKQLDLEHVNKDDGKEVPLQDQLQPILVIGFTMGIAMLIFEIIWKRFIEKIELGKLVSAYYNDSQSKSAQNTFKMDKFFVRIPKPLSHAPDMRKHDSYSRIEFIHKRAALIDVIHDSNCVTVIADIHHEEIVV